MKTFAARLSVLALALTGFTATTLAAKISHKDTVKPAAGVIVSCCGWNDPHCCGMQ